MKKANILTAAEAASYIKDGMTVVPSEFVGSCCPHDTCNRKNPACR